MSFVRRDTKSYVEATRVVEDSIIAAVLVPGKHSALISMVSMFPGSFLR